MANVIINAETSCANTTNGGGVITGDWTSINTQDGTITITGAIVGLVYTSPAYTAATDGTFDTSGLPDDSYTITFTGSVDTQSYGPVVISCYVEPEPDPEPEIPGTATPPAAKYMAVGGVLPNPIEYQFNFQVNDAATAPKTGHYVIVNIYKEDETTPSATARARVRNGAAKVDVSRFVQTMLSIAPPAGTDIIQADAGALVRYHIGFVEVWAGVTMAEVMVADKYAVNAALQSLVNDFTDHVIQPAA